MLSGGLRLLGLNRLSRLGIRDGASMSKRFIGARQTTLAREIETSRGLLDGYIQQQKTMELTVAGTRPDNLKISSPAVTPGGPIGPNRSRNIMVAFLISRV